ncbi:MAG: fluoroacetyl-CoA thioesterase, partial [Nocardioidaceae bacterium]|nr:fluoroacetyl-CoA thioesterase [Nocardioidaceae bacterium]
FQVAALDADGTLLATGEIRRVVVDRERFMSRVKPVGD